MSLNNVAQAALPVAELPQPILVALFISSVLIIGALSLTLVRAIRGPTPFDRVVALDLMGGICLCVIIVCAIRFNQPVLLEAAFVIALVSFLGTVVFARYLGEKDT